MSKFEVVYDDLARAWSADCLANNLWAPYPPRKGGRTDRLLTMATQRILAASGERVDCE